MILLVFTNICSNYPIFLALKFPTIMGAISGIYICTLIEGSRPQIFDLYLSSLAVVAGLFHLALTFYTSSLSRSLLDPVKMTVQNTIVFLTLGVSGCAAILVFRN